MNTWISWKINKTVFLVLLGLTFLSHLPFIEADPDRNMSVGRGPFTDEGLNTIQVRNWVNSGELSLTTCDNLLKTPLLGFSLALTYKLFGTTHTVSRLHVLVLVFLSLLWIGWDRKSRGIISILLLITLLQYQVFQSSHFSMAEMLSVAAILLSVHFLARSSDPEFSRAYSDRQAVLSGLFLSLSYFIKIQFIYLILLLPVLLLIFWIRGNFFSRKMILRKGFAITGTLLLFLLIYLFAWYLPNKEAYDYMMAHQSGEFKISAKIWEYIRFNLGYHFMKGWFQWFAYIFLGLAITGFILLKKHGSTRYPVYFLASIVWFLIELHKLTMAYLPTRYQVSLFASMGLLMSVVICELISFNYTRSKRLLWTTGLLLILVLLSINCYNYSDTFQHRTYAIRDANRYLSLRLSKDDIVLGAWAPSLTWNSKSKALPVWNKFLNYKQPLSTFKPKVVIAETDEQDSEQAWKSQGINLASLADSSRTFRVGKWDVVIYFLE
jgi:hypothetical protein